MSEPQKRRLTLGLPRKEDNIMIGEFAHWMMSCNKVAHEESISQIPDVIKLRKQIEEKKVEIDANP